MPARVKRGTIVFREWGGDEGLSESEGTFASVDELFAICLDVSDPQLVDRIILSGHDKHGVPRTLTFALQSVTQGQN
jgi:hypothetical protein